VDSTLSTLAETHYENFPVGSLFLPAEYRKPIRLVYAFARVADDFADEGSDSPEVRLQRLDRWEGGLKAALSGKGGDQFFEDLSGIIRLYDIPVSLFSDLIEAFRMDARGTTYATFEDLRFYCRRSADPVGRILLHLFRAASAELCGYSDSICTALQLTNFWQDLSIDIKRNRLYIPREDFERFGLTVEELTHGRGTASVHRLLKFEVGRTRELFAGGLPLLRAIDKRFAFELRLTVNGGMRILEKIAAQDFDTLIRRPHLSKLDWALLFGRSLLRR